MSRLFQQDSFLTLNKRYEEEENQVIEICINPDSKKITDVPYEPFGKFQLLSLIRHN